MLAQRPPELSMDPRDIGPLNEPSEAKDIPNRGAKRFPSPEDGESGKETTTTLAGTTAKIPRVGNPIYVNAEESTPGNRPFIAGKNLEEALRQAGETQGDQDYIPPSEQYAPPKKPVYFQGDTKVAPDNLGLLREHQSSIAPEEK